MQMNDHNVELAAEVQIPRSIFIGRDKPHSALSFKTDYSKLTWDTLDSTPKKHSSRTCTGKCPQ